VFTPVNQSGVQLTYDYGSATPTTISLNQGRFGPGSLRSWVRATTLRIGQRGSLSIEADDTDQRTDSGSRYVQWLERASFAYQSGPDSSLAFGARRIVGTAPLLDGVQTFQSTWNLSAGYHLKTTAGELYVVYGDAAAVSTVPAFLVKFIRYVGAQKGT
jgi:hypothetical protein